MKGFLPLLAATLPLLASLEQRASAIAITTLFDSNNGGSVGGAVYFDVNISNPRGLVFTRVFTSVEEVGTAGGLQLYATSLGGTSVGNETNIGAWTLLASGTGTGLGDNQPTLFDISDFALTPGQYGFALVLSDLSHEYTNGNGSNQFYSNLDLSLTLGSASDVPFSGGAFRPRVWNGTLEYREVPGPLPVLSLGAAFGFSRRLRRRLKQA
jgi:hypothetical protein